MGLLCATVYTLPDIRIYRSLRVNFTQVERWEMTTCYQCEKECNYLFDDSRCWECTRLTPEEVRGEENFEDEDEKEDEV